MNVLAIELSSLLNELNCPFESLTTGNPSGRFNSSQGSLQLLDYLTSELMCLQMYHCNKSADKGNVIELQETPIATALMGISSALGMGEPPAALVTTDLFHRLNTRLDEVLAKVGRDRIGKPLLNSSQVWDGKQWADLEKRHAELDQEYDLRREMLLTRLDCTVQAFNWSERMKHRQSHILETYKSKLVVLEKLVKGGSSTDIVALLAARDLLLAIEKASSAAVLKNTKSKIQRHIIGSVPDRGKGMQVYSFRIPINNHFYYFQVGGLGSMLLRLRKCRHGRKIERPGVVSIEGAVVVVDFLNIEEVEDIIVAQEVSSNSIRIAKPARSIKIHTNRGAATIQIVVVVNECRVVGLSEEAVDEVVVDTTRIHLIQAAEAGVRITTGTSQPAV